MNHPLFDRFQGALLGAALGEMMGWQRQEIPSGVSVRCDRYPENLWNRGAEEFLLWLPIARSSGDSSADPSADSSGNSLAGGGWGRIVVAGCQDLIQHRSWANMGDRLQNLPSHLDWNRAAGIELLALPLVLYCHENWEQLRRQMTQWQQAANPECKPSASVGGSLLAWSLSSILCQRWHGQRWHGQRWHGQRWREPVELPHWLEQARVDVGAPLAEMEIVKDWLEPTRPIKAIAKELAGLTHTQPPGTIAAMAALYSFLRTPTDARLTLLQTAQLGYVPPVSCAIAGALTGAYNGPGGWPLRWRSQLHLASVQAKLHHYWGMASEDDLLRLAQQLLLAWAGMDGRTAQGTDGGASAMAMPVVAAHPRA